MAHSPGETLEPLPLQVGAPTVRYQGVEIPVATPRRVRLSRGRKLSLAFLILVVAVFPSLPVLISPRSPATSLLPVITWVLFACAAPLVYLKLRDFQRERRLLISGDLALARVTLLQTKSEGGSPVGTAQVRYITYQFRDHTGRVVTTTSKDRTKSLSRGMTVPVVYERSKPKNNLALCSVNFGDFEVLP